MAAHKQANSPRSTVISVRLDDVSVEVLDLLVSSGLAQSRSEAAAQLISIGIRSANETLLAQARQIAEQVQSVKREFMESIKQRDVQKVKELVSIHRELVDTKTEDGVSSLLTAVYLGAQDVAEVLVSHGAQQTLFEAAALGDTNRVKVILDESPDELNSFSPDGWTALHLASFFGHVGTVQYLLNLGADFTLLSQNQIANTALHAAVFNRRHEVAKRLLVAGADVNAYSGARWAPIHLAAFNGDLEMIQLLLTHGADLSLRNEANLTPLEIAQQRGNTEAVELLREIQLAKGANDGSTDKEPKHKNG